MRVTDDTKMWAQKILDFIEVNPHLHDQRKYVSVDGSNCKRVNAAVISEDENVCNTTMCIAGTQRWLEKGFSGLMEFEFGAVHEATERAGDALGLDYAEADMIFMNMSDSSAVDMLRAVAAGDAKKFYEVFENSE